MNTQVDILTLHSAILNSNINFEELAVSESGLKVRPCTREIFGAVKEMVRDLHLNLWVERTSWTYFTVKSL